MLLLLAAFLWTAVARGPTVAIMLAALCAIPLTPLMLFSYLVHKKRIAELEKTLHSLTADGEVPPTG
jgi:hypothetical protein